jgi:hypothetical protein
MPPLRKHRIHLNSPPPNPSQPAPPLNQTVTFFCPGCKRTEDIPADVVLHFDLMDAGDQAFPPRFLCSFGCRVMMTPLQFTSHLGYTYLTDPTTGKCSTSPP